MLQKDERIRERGLLLIERLDFGPVNYPVHYHSAGQALDSVTFSGSEMPSNRSAIQLDFRVLTIGFGGVSRGVSKRSNPIGIGLT